MTSNASPLKTQLRVGGVPEHFNAPWNIAISQDDFARRPYQVTWREFPGGTGAMCKALDAREIDVAVLLADGVLRAISKGSKIRVIGTYVDSPLYWGIHVLAGEVFAISRNGSGSHLMTFVEAHARGWLETREPRFEIVGNIDGAREAMAEGRASGFLWERLMTRPLVDAGEWRQIGVRPSPWPAFLIAAHEDVIASHGELLHDMITVVQRRCHEMKAARTRTIDYISERFELDAGQVSSWLDETRWRCASEVSAPALREAVTMLHRVGVIDELRPVEDFVDTEQCGLGEVLPEALYDHRIGGVRDALARANKAFGPLDYEELTVLGEFDRYYDYGTESCQDAVRLLALREGDKLLEIGSRLGAAARYFAQRTRCEVTGVEIQPALAAIGRELTRRCGMEEQFQVIIGDICGVPLPSEHFDHAVSLMVMLHLEDRAPAWRNTFDALKPGGKLLVEDLILTRPFEEPQRAMITRILEAPSLVDMENYQRELETAGFDIIEREDLTEVWTARSEERYERFTQERDLHIQTHGVEVYEARRLFLQVMRDLFEIGMLQAARFKARRPH
jgi:cyclopropane fatty-acyl-phospholipid synthase-like methyltransferase/ABC-type nitrate/sulfonate/bicarbonate transport system substrate-binding protein